MSRIGAAVRVLVGGAAGLVAGAIVAVNVAIAFGIDRGYEAGLPEVFAESPLAGILMVAALLGGPVLGALVALRIRPPPGDPLVR